jgi:hypothetical protein
MLRWQGGGSDSGSDERVAQLLAAKDAEIAALREQLANSSSGALNTSSSSSSALSERSAAAARGAAGTSTSKIPRVTSAAAHPQQQQQQQAANARKRAPQVMTDDLLADAHALESPAKKQALSSNASNKENAGPVGRTPSKREPASTPAKVRESLL